jgi:beta-mannosidase
MAVGLFLTPQTGQSQTDRLLNDGWRFRSVTKTELPASAEWHPAQVPGCTHLDLLANKLIGDPFYRDNEAHLQWIGLTDWQYEKSLSVTAADLRHDHVELIFDGLDTLADISINGKPVLHADNMFRRWQIPARELLHVGDNLIQITFHSPTNTLLPEMRKLPFVLPNNLIDEFKQDEGMSSESYIRKASYQWGTDWGPRFMTEGIWKDVYLREWDNYRIENFHIEQRKITAAHAELTGLLTLQSDVSGEAEITIHSRNAQNHSAVEVVHFSTPIDVGINHIPALLSIKNPSLWYPNGYGAQPLYTFTATVTFRQRTDTTTVRTGLRSVELRREPDQWGISFQFVVNGIPIFAKGASVIPFDFFPTRVTEDKYRSMLEAAHDSHMNMIRAWGGGIYEQDRFYEICDELGLMVWQEFSFNGAMVPGDRRFQENVRQEATEQVTRLRDHPSIVLWCGNNELEIAWGEWGYRMFALRALKAADAEKIRQDYIVLFSDIIKSVVQEYGGGLPYRPSSPSSSYDFSNQAQTDGDMHSWDVWGQSAPYREYAKQFPRFMTEFGFQSFPTMETIQSFTLPEDRSADSDVMLRHQKVGDGNKRILNYLLEDYARPRDFASFVYLSQVQQAEIIKFATEHLRRDRPRTMGVLYWQLNDVWPVASWSSIDYAGRWKALQYYAARFFNDLLVSPNLHEGKLDVSIVSDKLQPVTATLRTRLMDFNGKLLSDESQPLTIAPQSSTLLTSLDEKKILGSSDSRNVFAVFDLSVNGKVESRNLVFFGRFKNLNLPHAKIDAKLRAASDSRGGYDLTLQSAQFAKDVYANFADAATKLDNNFVDLLPGEARTVHISSNLPLSVLQEKMTVTSLTDAY